MLFVNSIIRIASKKMSNTNTTNVICHPNVDLTGAGRFSIHIPVVVKVLHGGVVCSNVLGILCRNIGRNELHYATISIKVTLEPEEYGGQVKCVGALVQIEACRSTSQGGVDPHIEQLHLYTINCCSYCRYDCIIIH